MRVGNRGRSGGKGRARRRRGWLNSEWNVAVDDVLERLRSLHRNVHARDGRRRAQFFFPEVQIPVKNSSNIASLADL